MLVAQHGGLRAAGRAAGEEQHGEIVGVHVPVARTGMSVCSCGGVGAEHLGGDGRDPRESAQPLEVGFVGDGDGGTGPLGERQEIVGGKAIVERHVGDARPRRAEQGDRQRRARLVAHDCGLDSRSPVAVGCAVGAVVELAVGEPVVE